MLKVDDPHAVVMPTLMRMEGDTPAAYEKSLRGVPQPRRMAMATWLYRAEINNGGHDQFYWNSSGVVWRDALAGLEAAGLTSLAEILAASVKRFPAEPSLDRVTRQHELAEYAPNFDDLDQAFQAVEIETDIDAAMMAYIRQHAEAFVSTPRSLIERLKALFRRA